MKDLRGNLILVSLNENREKRLILVFKVPYSKFKLQYITDKFHNIYREVDILLGKPIKLEEIRKKAPLGCGTCTLGNFSGSRFSLMNEPRLFVFSSNIMSGSWKIYTDDRDKKLYLLRMA